MGDESTFSGDVEDLMDVIADLRLRRSSSKDSIDESKSVCASCG
jgi:hypothetical protein